MGCCASQVVCGLLWVAWLGKCVGLVAEQGDYRCNEKSALVKHFVHKLNLVMKPITKTHAQCCQKHMPSGVDVWGVFSCNIVRHLQQIDCKSDD
jgi:hypothetical protein